MPKLVTTDSVKTRGALPSDPEVEIALDQTLNATSLALEAFLDTSFTREVITDTFWVDTSHRPFEGNYPTLRLTKALVDPAQTITVEYAGSLEQFSKDKETLEPFQFVLDSNRGVISLSETAIDSVFVRVTYTAGLNLDTPDVSIYDQATVPEWLKEAATMHALALLNITTKLGPSEKRSEIATQMLNHVGMILDPKKRPKGGIRPI